MAHSEPRILSQPHRVVFAGFESTTTRLQQEGWQLSAEQDWHGDAIRLALYFAPCDLKMLSQPTQHRFHGAQDRYAPMELTFRINHVSANLLVRLDETRFDFQPIDAMPTFVDTPYKKLEDFGIFASPLVRTEEIVIEPESVAECMEWIRKLQAPQLQEIRARNLQRERRDAINQQNFHAQIITLAA